MVNYRMKKVKSKKDGKTYKVPVPVGGGGGKGKSKSKGSSGGSSGGSSPSKPKPSLFAGLVAGGTILTIAGGLGYAEATAIENKAMELAGIIGISSGAGLLAWAGALKLANTAAAERLPMVGGMVRSIGRQWTSFLKDFGMRA